MTKQAVEIIETVKNLTAKNGEAPYVKMFGNDDLIIWRNEEASENDNGANAEARYTLSAQTIEDLGSVDFVCDVD